MSIHLSRVAPALSLALSAAVLLTACQMTPNQAPIEDRSTAAKPAVDAMTGEPAKPLPGAENAGKPGYYTVRPGDTMIRIGLDNGQNWRDLVRWNSLDNPNVIEVGQVLRVVAPTVDATAAHTRPIGTPRIEARPLEAKPPIVGTASVSPAAPTLAPGPIAVSPPTSPSTSPPTSPPMPAPTAQPASPAADGVDAVVWAWPSSDAVTAPFDDGKGKGLDFAGNAGDPVFAAGDGRVVYAGSGLRGYGNLIILKHNATYLTAYAHNQTLLVKEDQSVKRGQKIAEMGATDADRVKLHFEIRKLGKPVDPLALLPSR